MKKSRTKIYSKKMLWILAIILILAIGIFGYNYFQRNQVEEEVEKSVEILESGDMEKINELIFSRSSEIENNDSEGILAQVFKGIDIKIAKIDGNRIELTINTKDLSQFFQDAEDSGEMYTGDSLLSYLKKYKEKSSNSSFSASVPYERIDGNIVIDYDNESLIDAMSGGLITSYKEAYQELLDEYQKEISR